MTRVRGLRGEGFVLEEACEELCLLQLKLLRGDTELVKCLCHLVAMTIWTRRSGRSRPRFAGGHREGCEEEIVVEETWSGGQSTETRQR